MKRINLLQVKAIVLLQIFTLSSSPIVHANCFDPIHSATELVATDFGKGAAWAGATGLGLGLSGLLMWGAVKAGTLVNWNTNRYQSSNTNSSLGTATVFAALGATAFLVCSCCSLYACYNECRTGCSDLGEGIALNHRDQIETCMNEGCISPVIKGFYEGLFEEKFLGNWKMTTLVDVYYLLKTRGIEGEQICPEGRLMGPEEIQTWLGHQMDFDVKDFFEYPQSPRQNEFKKDAVIYQVLQPEATQLNKRVADIFEQEGSLPEQQKRLQAEWVDTQALVLQLQVDIQAEDFKTRSGSEETSSLGSHAIAAQLESARHKLTRLQEQLASLITNESTEEKRKRLLKEAYQPFHDYLEQIARETKMSSPPDVVIPIGPPSAPQSDEKNK